jgi:DNA polymerase I-like protein with 3'-5' exonuclease and polymerase domains
MLSFDTETTGIKLQNGCTTFAIGMYNGSYSSQQLQVNPLTRSRIGKFNPAICKAFNDADMLIAHNAKFDVKALCEAELIDWREPDSPEFWKRIIDISQLAHLNCSIDKMSLDSLTKEYLDRGYESEDDLMTAVNKCRALVRSKRFKAQYGDWIIAEDDGDHESFASNRKGSSWGRMDYWLPDAVLAAIPQAFRPKIPDSMLEGVLNRYLKADCVNTYELAEHFFAALLHTHGDDLERLLNINRSIDHVLWKMETRGIWVNIPELQDCKNACDHYINILTQKCFELSGVDKLTDDSVRDLLFETWQLDPVSYTKKEKKPSVDANTFLKLHETVEENSREYQFLGCFLSLKKYQKKLQSLNLYNNSRNKLGYLHPDINSTGTATTRVAMRNPGMQQVSKAGNPFEDDADDIAKWLEASPMMRSCFGPPPGWWWLSGDYSQLQLRIFAVVTGEKGMIDAFARGWDAHDYTARRIFRLSDSAVPTKSQRRVAKNVNFGFIFGATPKRIEKTAGQPGLWDVVVQLFPNAHEYILHTKEQIAIHGNVQTLDGYPLEVRDQFNRWTGQWEKAAHAGVCFIVQGSEGVIVKRAMRYVDDYLVNEYPEGRIVLQVHDELDTEVRERIPKRHVREIKGLMEQAASELGVYAPVDMTLIKHRWDQETKIILA